MSARAIEAELEASEPWRRSKQFIAKPYGERNRDVAKRFLKHFLDGAEGLEMPGSEWTYADVFRGDDEGGSNNPMGAAAAAVLAAKRRRRNVRVGKAIALFKTHMLIETIKEHVRQNYANDPEGVIDWFERTECGGATSEPAVNEIKAEMTAATLLGTVGYKLGSVSSFALCLQQMNCRISDVNDRFEEHDLAVFVLDKLAKAAQQAVSTDALKEYDADAADRRCLQLNAGLAGGPPAGARSLDRVIEVFGKQWDSLMNAHLIHERPKGGRQSSSGNSTRVDGMAGELFEYDRDSGGITPVYADEGSIVSAFDIFLQSDHSPSELYAALESAMAAEPKGAMAREKICFRCFGLGHTENEDRRFGTKGCSSPKRNPPRDINGFLLLVTAMASRRKERQGQSRVPIEAQSSPSEAPRYSPRGSSRGRGGRGRGPPRGRPAWWRSDVEESIEEEKDDEDRAETCDEEEADGADAVMPAPVKKKPVPVIDSGATKTVLPEGKAPREFKEAMAAPVTDPFGSSIEDDADWADPYEMEEISEIEEPSKIGLGTMLALPLRMLKQFLIMMLWMWTSPALAIINSLPGSNALAVPPSFPSAYYPAPLVPPAPLFPPAPSSLS